MAANRRGERGTSLSPKRWPSPSPTAFRAAAILRASNGNRSAGAGSGSTPPRPLARSEWLAVGEVAGTAAGARILSAAAIDLVDIEALFGDRIESFREVRFDPATNAIAARKGRRLGAIRIATAPDPNPDADAIAAGLAEAVRRHGLALLPWPESAQALRHRAAFAAAHDPAIPSLDDAALLATIDDWLAPLLTGKRRLDAIEGLRGALDGLLGYEAMRAIDRLAPTHFTSPAGSTHPIDYAAPGRPSSRSPRAGAVRPKGASGGGGRARPTDAGDHQSSASPDPDHARPARLLGGVVARGGQGNARPLPAPPVARRPRRRPADAAHQAGKPLIWGARCAIGSP